MFNFVRDALVALRWKTPPPLQGPPKPVSDKQLHELAQDYLRARNSARYGRNGAAQTLQEARDALFTQLKPHEKALLDSEEGTKQFLASLRTGERYTITPEFAERTLHPEKLNGTRSVVEIRPLGGLPPPNPAPRIRKAAEAAKEAAKTNESKLLTSLRNYLEDIDEALRHPDSKGAKANASDAFKEITELLEEHELPLLKTPQGMQELINALERGERASLTPQKVTEILATIEHEEATRVTTSLAHHADHIERVTTKEVERPAMTISTRPAPAENKWLEKLGERKWLAGGIIAASIGLGVLLLTRSKETKQETSNQQGL